jgi:hypothetical protein
VIAHARGQRLAQRGDAAKIAIMDLAGTQRRDGGALDQLRGVVRRAADCALSYIP